MEHKEEIMLAIKIVLPLAGLVILLAACRHRKDKIEEKKSRHRLFQMKRPRVD